ncbi:MAG: pilus assembly protein PilP [[Actinobacillus] rossii]|uniref:Pilus assembly protein, PilP n=1 Tax=[Actinobacillus] rossii TaxID=123820 RepID=A0A380TN91_9PAST|nr:pilus assembly protein PilP [[Actinobacillus] rossii]MDY4506506.1 pilus assembly protein PilP [[Actinobacillus] rossii]SUT87257.1 Pilus assembly protein, PilP [[Actinobacillus] rossii]
MHFIGYFLLFFILLTAAEARDPFNKENMQTAAPTAAEQHTKSTTCNANENTIADNLTFKQLRVIGVLIEEKQQEALFINDEKQIFSVKVGEFVSSEKLQIKTITKQKITLSQWQANCENTDLIILKL